MRKCALLLSFVVLALGAWFLAVARAGPAAPGAANADVEKVADAVNNPAQLRKLAAGLVTNFELRDVSWAFKPREKGGLGVGPQPGAIDPDAIQLKLIQMGGQKGISAADLKANKADYQRVAEITRAIAEAMPGYVTKYTANAGTAKQWVGFADDMKKGSDDLIAAIKGNNLQAIKQAAGKLNMSCNGCHTAFRDN